MKHEFLDQGKLLWEFMDRIEVCCPKCQGPALVTKMSGGEEIPRCSCSACGFAVRGQNYWFRPWRATFRGRCTSCRRSYDKELRAHGGEIPQAQMFHCAPCEVHVRTVRVTWAGERGIHDPYFGMTLRLQASFGAEILWAYNLEHLNFLEAFVGATQRKREAQRNASLASRLPQWIKKAQHRETLLKRIAELRAKH